MTLEVIPLFPRLSSQSSSSHLRCTRSASSLRQALDKGQASSSTVRWNNLFSDLRVPGEALFSSHRGWFKLPSFLDVAIGSINKFNRVPGYHLLSETCSLSGYSCTPEARESSCAPWTCVSSSATCSSPGMTCASGQCRFVLPPHPCFA